MKKEDSKLKLVANLPLLLTILFVTLKLTKQIDWSWIWVFVPLWGPIALILIVPLVWALFSVLIWLVKLIVRNYKKIVFKLFATKTTGIVLRIKERESCSEYYFHPIITFKANNGEESIFTSKWGYNYHKYNVGDEIDVFYRVKKGEIIAETKLDLGLSFETDELFTMSFMFTLVCAFALIGALLSIIIFPFTAIAGIWKKDKEEKIFVTDEEFFEACKSDDLKKVQDYLEDDGCTINKNMFPSGTTALIEAINHGQVEIVKTLLGDKRINIYRVDRFGNTALTVKTENEEIKTLLSNYIAHKKGPGEFRISDFFRVLKTKNYGSTEIFLDFKNVCLRGYDVFFDILSSCDTGLISKILIRDDVDFNFTKSNSKDSPLMKFVRSMADSDKETKLKVLEWLMKDKNAEKIDVNYKNSSGETALDVASRHVPEAMELLLRHPKSIA